MVWPALGLGARLPENPLPTLKQQPVCRPLPLALASTPRPLQGDPFKTLFVGRLSFDVTERKLRREFEEYGPIKSIRLVHDKNSGGRISEMSIFKRGEGVSLRSIKSIRLVHR